MKNKFILAALLFFILMLVYSANYGFELSNDTKGNIILVDNLLKNKSFSIDPRKYPNQFFWLYKHKGKKYYLRIPRWSGCIKKEPLDKLYKNNKLIPINRYYIAKTKLPGIYVSPYGIGTALTAFPVYYLAYIFDNKICTSEYDLFILGKISASICSALIISILFLISLFFMDKSKAFFTLLIYGLATSLWSISSQGLWQHACVELYTTIAAYFFILTFKSKSKRTIFLSIIFCAFASSFAVYCRPTGIILCMCFLFYLLLSKRTTESILYLSAAAPFAIILCYYNYHYFGNFFTLIQYTASRNVAALTGSPSLWQTPLLLGISGVLISPSRGMLIYSPILIFGFIGAVYCLRHKEYHFLLPFIIAAFLSIIIAAKWWAWWFGWSYGYRALVDAVPLLIIISIPFVSHYFNRQIFKICFCILAILSIIVQIIGAFAYYTVGWNYLNRIDAQHRLWEVKNSQIIYYIKNFQSSMNKKRELVDKYKTIKL